jgi:hypothetical protein
MATEMEARNCDVKHGSAPRAFADCGDGGNIRNNKTPTASRKRKRLEALGAFERPFWDHATNICTILSQHFTIGLLQDGPANAKQITTN